MQRPTFQTISDLVSIRSYLGEGGSFALGLDLDDLGAALKDGVDVLLAELVSLRVVVHHGSVRALLQQVLHLLLAELTDL